MSLSIFSPPSAPTSTVLQPSFHQPAGGFAGGVAHLHVLVVGGAGRWHARAGVLELRCSVRFPPTAQQLQRLL